MKHQPMLVPRRGTILARWARILPHWGHHRFHLASRYRYLRCRPDVWYHCHIPEACCKMMFSMRHKELISGWWSVVYSDFLVYCYFGWLSSLWLQYHIVSIDWLWIRIDIHWYIGRINMTSWLLTHNSFTFSGCTPRSPQKGGEM